MAPALKNALTIRIMTCAVTAITGISFSAAAGASTPLMTSHLLRQAVRRAAPHPVAAFQRSVSSAKVGCDHR